jgi:hypothetical protein
LEGSNAASQREAQADEVAIGDSSSGSASEQDPDPTEIAIRKEIREGKRPVRGISEFDNELASTPGVGKPEPPPGNETQQFATQAYQPNPIEETRRAHEPDQTEEAEQPPVDNINTADGSTPSQSLGSSQEPLLQQQIPQELPPPVPVLQKFWVDRFGLYVFPPVPFHDHNVCCGGLKFECLVDYQVHWGFPGFVYAHHTGLGAFRMNFGRR